MDSVKLLKNQKTIMKRPDNIYGYLSDIEIHRVMSVSSLCCVSVSTQSFVQPVRTDSIKQAERGRVTA